MEISPLRPQDIVRYTRFWYDDGSVVIQAENTQFRVHRSILAAQSDVWATMFSIPQSVELSVDVVRPHYNPTFFGCFNLGIPD